MATNVPEEEDLCLQVEGVSASWNSGNTDLADAFTQ